MLILSRRDGESILIGDDIEVVIIHKFGRDVKVGIRAPREIRILRSEILERQKDKEEKKEVPTDLLFCCKSVS